MLTSRPHQVVFDAPYFPAKTPSRALKGRVENAIHPGAKTAGPKSKNVGLRTTFAPKSVQPDRISKDVIAGQGKQAAGLGSVRQVRPLGDKTPFPNRIVQQHSPVEIFAKLPKLVFIDSELSNVTHTTPDVLRPSSTRKHLRPPRSASKSFETPLNRGNPWDVSDGSVIVPEANIQDTILEDDDFEEIEYMPPNTLNLPYEPSFGFELPDYKALGQTIRHLAFSIPYDDFVPPEISTPPRAPPPIWDILPLPKIDDDNPFHPVRKYDENGILKGQSAPERQRFREMPVRKINSATRPVSSASVVTTANAKSTSRVSSRMATATLNTTTVKTTLAVSHHTSAVPVKPHRTTATSSTRAPKDPITFRKAPASNVPHIRPSNTVSSLGAVAPTRTRVSTIPKNMTRPATSVSFHGPTPTTVAKMPTTQSQKLKVEKATGHEFLLLDANHWELDDDFRFNV